MAPRIGGEIDRVDAGSLTYAQFVERYMKPNLPVVLTGLTASWPSRTDWVQEDDHPNLRFFSSLCPNSTVQVADCDKKEYSEQKRVEMTVAEFIRGWVEDGCGGGNPSDQPEPESFLYLKDWHFVKEYPDYCAYSTPAFFMDDWLNTYLDSHTLHRDSDISPHQNEANCADYRFVYMGPKGQSHVHGHLYMLMCLGHIAGQQMCAVESIGSFYRLLSLTFLFIGMVLFSLTVWLECTQQSGEVIFVPSGWYHQVQNLEDTISINHNWFNGYNLSWVWNLLVEDYKIAKEYIEDIRDISDDFEGLCQRNLAANTGMNFYDFFIFITRYALANMVELYHAPNSNAAIHLLHNLTSIQDVASKMTSQEAFNAQKLRTISSENYDAFSDVAKTFEEIRFHELCEAVNKAYNSIDGELDDDVMFEKGRKGIKKGCFLNNCSNEDCDVAGVVKGLVSNICGPDDLVDLIGRFVEQTQRTA